MLNIIILKHPELKIKFKIYKLKNLKNGIACARKYNNNPPINHIPKTSRKYFKVELDLNIFAKPTLSTL